MAKGHNGRLTDAAIRNAKPGNKRARLYDAGGLYPEIAPSGGKWWRLKYSYAGKEKRLSLGVYPAVGLAKARKQRDELRALLADGIDPAERRKAEKAAKAGADSFEAVAREWFAKQKPRWADSHSEKIIRRLERDVFPWLAARPVGEVKAPELLRVLRRIESRGAVETAHRALQNAGLGFRVDFIEHQLAHDVRDPLGTAYNRTKYLPERRAMMQAWADYLDTLKRGDNVVALHSRPVANR
jgi:hypothetical protein